MLNSFQAVSSACNKDIIPQFESDEITTECRRAHLVVIDDTVTERCETFSSFSLE